MIIVEFGNLNLDELEVKQVDIMVEMVEIEEVDIEIVMLDLVLMVVLPLDDEVDDDIILEIEVMVEVVEQHMQEVIIQLDEDIEVMVEFGESDEIDDVDDLNDKTVMLITHIEFEVMVEMVIYEVNDEILLR